jgi:hypothetical protein
VGLQCELFRIVGIVVFHPWLEEDIIEFDAFLNITNKNLIDEIS